MNYNHIPVTPEEDEIFSRIESNPQPYLNMACGEAQRFVDSRSAGELSITTLRKAFEIGYLTGLEDALRKQLADKVAEISKAPK